jgi:hypothetical protein
MHFPSARHILILVCRNAAVKAISFSEDRGAARACQWTANMTPDTRLGSVADDFELVLCAVRFFDASEELRLPVAHSPSRA